MNINVNNKTITTDAANLSALAQELSLPEKGVAAAIENKMVPTTLWEQTPLEEGTAVVIIKSACGG